METVNFWNDRVKKYGHTGWADKVIYAYDQQARLMAIEAILNSLTCNKSVALDFGTGSGDFANLLSKQFEKVIAFDVSYAAVEVAKKRYEITENINFLYGNNICEAGIAKNTVDMILSVTVLGHIMSDPELIQTINHFRNILTEDGTIIAIEYASDYEKPITSSYQRCMKLEEWRSVFLRCGFHLHKFYGFYHPTKAPCQSYLSYVRRFNNFRGKLLRLLINRVNHDMVNRYLNRLAYKYIRGQNDFFGQEDQQQSPTKIMIFRKQRI